jgi:hypothetical protein
MRISEAPGDAISKDSKLVNALHRRYVVENGMGGAAGHAANRSGVPRPTSTGAGGEKTRPREYEGCERRKTASLWLSLDVLQPNVRGGEYRQS